MKRSIGMVLVLLLLLSACGQGGETAATPTAAPSVTPAAAVSEPSATVEPTPMPTPAAVEVPEDMTIWLEGMEETVHGYRRTSGLGYSMVYDPQYFRPEEYEGYDHYTAVTEYAAPWVYLRVTKDSRSVDRVIEELEGFGAYHVSGFSVGGCHGERYAWESGYDYDDVVIDYYVVQAGTQVFLVEHSCTWELAEGIGQRMGYMVRSIRFEDVPEATELTLTVRGREVTDFTSAVGEMTTLYAEAETGAACPALEWTVGSEEVCELWWDGNVCDVLIVGEGVTKVTAEGGGLKASVIVRGIPHW